MAKSFDELVKAAGPPGKGAKASASSDPMGLPTDEGEETPADDGSDFEAAATEMLDAIKAGDMTTAKEAFSAAITAKCADILGKE